MGSNLKINKFLLLHFIILLWGFTPVLGKLISLQALDLVFWRLVFSGLSLFIYLRFKGASLRINWKGFVSLMGWGAVVGLHWYFFYHAIKVSNVAITMAGFSSITLFASVVQPLVLKKKFFWGDAVYGLIIAAAILVILQFEKFYALGIFYGVLAALTAALFGVYNGKLILKHDAGKITFYEFLGALVTICILQGLNGELGNIQFPLGSDLIYLLILSVFCTTLAFTLSVEILKKIDPLTVIITNNLEPVYGVGFSLLIFGQSELMSSGFYIGASVLLIAVFTYPFFKRKFYKG
ncbi:MAG: DMT family transporter [Bacteroidia bacterium]|nr:DMT family transporter [Bacteroidia bacterium]MCF8426063.1 DMT family transporter [Bacteroidia bacterium]